MEQAEEQERLEVEQAEEKRIWELEMECEMRRWPEGKRRQMEILQTLVHGVQLQGEAAAKKTEGEKDVRAPKITEYD